MSELTKRYIEELNQGVQFLFTSKITTASS